MREDIERDERDYRCSSYKGTTCVIKNNGIYERFTHEKIVKSCLMVGSPLWAAERISSYVAKAAYDGISTAEIKMLVYDCLKRVDKKIADKYLASNNLRVRTSRDTIEAFDQRKIEKTLIVEQMHQESLQRKIATETWKELKKLMWTI